MSTLLRIERELTACNQARFEKLVSVLLKARGISGLSLLGSVEGKDKTRTGVPDIYATTDGKTFKFFACTTVTGASEVKSKLLDDVAECLDLKKTSIDPECIERLYLAFNSNIKPSALHEVAQSANGLPIEFLSLSEIALDLQQKYGWIARDELDIQLDSGQILPIEAFVTRYDHGKLATSLNTKFRFREDLVKEGIAALSAPSSSLLLTGAAGVGKTRLALEIARRIQEAEPACVTYCIYNKDLPLSDDLNRYFSEKGSYVILVDDTNRINGRTQILNLLDQADKDHIYRFIFTVRDYAERDISRDIARLASQPYRMKTGPLTRQQIFEYVENEFGVANDRYKAQIWALSQGNARLATMAAKEAIKTNSLASIEDVTDLYELYFSDVSDALTTSDGSLLKALGVMSVLRHVRRSDEDTARTILAAFGLPSKDLWSSLDKLHDLEFIDLHGRDVAKISDQVLATFCFYLCFIKYRELSFESLIAHFSEKSLQRIKDAVYGACNTMNVEKVRKVIDTPLVAAVKHSDLAQQLKILQYFWFVDTALALHTVHSAIESLPSPAPHAVYNWDSKRSGDSSEILAVLGRMRHSNESDISAAIQLAVDYLEKIPDQAACVLQLLSESPGFGFDHRSQESGYFIQRIVVERLTSVPLTSEAHSTLFIETAKRFLATEFHSAYAEDKHSMSICHFGLKQCTELLNIRTMLWQRLARLLEIGAQESRVRAALYSYAGGYSQYDDTAVLAGDMPELVKLVNLLDFSKLDDCRLLTKLCQRLERRGLGGLSHLRKQLCSPAFDLFRLVQTDWQERRAIRMGYQDYERFKAARFFAAYGHISVEELSGLMELCNEVRQGAPDDRGYYHLLQVSIVRLFEEIGRQDPPRLCALTSKYLDLGDPLELGDGWTWIQSLVRILGKNATKKALEQHEFPTKGLWLAALYLAIDEQEIEAVDVEHLLMLWENPTVRLPPLSLLRRFERHEPQILCKLIEIVIRTRGDQAGSALNFLLSHPKEEIDWVRAQCVNQAELLKQAYLIAQGDERSPHNYFDHDAALFDLILDLDGHFLTEYVRNRHSTHRWISNHDETRNYSGLWCRSDWVELFIALVDAVTELEHGLSYLTAWFPRAGADVSRTLSESQLSTILTAIQRRADKPAALAILFGSLCDIGSATLLAAFDQLLQVNPSFETFKELPWYSGHMSTSRGGFLSQYQGQMRFLDQLRDKLPPETAFLAHRAYLNEEMRHVEACIASEEERQFLDDDY